MATDSERDPLLASVNSSIGYSTQNPRDNYPNRDTNYFYSSVTINRWKQLLSGIAVLSFVLLERIAYYSLTGNLYLFLNQTDFHWMYYNAMSALLIFTGVSYLASLFGGWLSDAYLGRFKSITIAFIIYTFAYWFLPYMPEKICHSCTTSPLPIFNSTDGYDIPLHKECCSWEIMLVLIFIGIGTGTVKANITPFGAEQVRYSGPDGLRRYLNWLYWCVNIGALIAILGITYVQQEDSFQKGYLIPVCLLSVATVLFLCSYPLYTHQAPCGSSISRIMSVLREAWKRNQKGNRNDSNSSSSLEVINRPTWLDMAKVRYGGRFHESVVEDVKALSTITIVFINLIPYWMLYFQMQSTFLAQGLQMRLSLTSSNSTDGKNDNSEFSVPAAWLMLFNVLFLIIFIPLMNHVVYPFLDKRGIQISMLTRIGVGMACATLSMSLAGCLELCRLTFIDRGWIVNQTIENTVYVAADLSILYQIPQYSLIGMSEVFTSVTGMEFAVSQAPTVMQGAVMGLYYFCTGIGSFLGVAALRSFEKIEGAYIGRHSSGLNNGELYVYFFTLAAIQLASLVVFSFVSKRLKVRRTVSPTASRLLSSSS